jgi:tRNA threonylcarbamoyladenosine modification (KEOPS) complex Cgi121 subunit
MGEKIRHSAYMELAELRLNGLIIKRASSKLDMDELLSVIGSINSNRGFIQVFDPKSTINKTHLIGAYVNSVLAFADKANKTKSIAMEMLLFAAMTDQIDKAVSIIGAKKESDIIVFSNNKSSFGRLANHLIKQSEFRPDATHIRSCARLFGIKSTYDNIDSLVLQRIALSRMELD